MKQTGYNISTSAKLIEYTSLLRYIKPLKVEHKVIKESA